MPTRHTTWDEVRETPAATRSEAQPWVATGIGAGVFGAFWVALLFLVIDWLGGMPFRTPTLLGAILFQGEMPAPDTFPHAVLVSAYTVFHGVVFIAVGLIASAALAVWPAPRPTWKTGVLVGAALFAALEAIFLSFGALFEPELIATLGGGRVALANALAAGAMALVLVVAARRAEKLP